MESSAKEPFVSFLTPVYNGEKYLEKCITSVLRQTYENWEYVIVNNQSTDRSLEIAQKYAAQNDRIRIHNNDQFLNLMPNLNHAFRQISPKSEYCKVVHADDWIFPECAERMVDVAVQHRDIGIVSSYCLEETQVSLDGLPYPSHHVSGREICRRLLLEGLFPFSSPSSMLIRSDMIRKQDKMYDESHPHGDLSACFNILLET
ncbi:MAG TPA: glycosyltransferase family A protein, partial [Balneolaceae bacterium]|nr:glycosyltransferase family A protein [Balneolaceae bacterium]